MLHAPSLIGALDIIGNPTNLILAVYNSVKSIVLTPVSAVFVFFFIIKRIDLLWGESGGHAEEYVCEYISRNQEYLLAFGECNQQYFIINSE